MKVLSLWQPWATLLVTCEKKIETRHWYFRHRGPLLIHAAKHFTKVERRLCREWPFVGALFKYAFHADNLPLGAIIGRVNVVNCLPTIHHYFKTIDIQERAFGNFDIGRFGIICDSPVLFDEPIPTRGFQGLFNYDLPGPRE